MKTKISGIVVVLLSITAFAAQSFAWNDTGHKVSAYVAWQQMTPEARERAFKILVKAPEDSDLSTFYNAYDSRSEAVKRLELFMIAATWADIVRNRDFKVRYEKYNQGDWHYADIFWKQVDGKPEILKDFPEESGKAIPKLCDFEKILRDENAADADKAVALAWFLHVGGDIHNPLHNASRVTELEPKGDQGGNMFVLTPRDAPRRINLHSYWDSLISANMPRENDACDQDYIPMIGAKLIDKFPFSKMKDRLNLGRYDGWNLEGFNFLNSDVYSSNLEREKLPSEEYRRRSFETAQQQLAIAGYRLGETLNLIFAGEKKPAAK